MIIDADAHVCEPSDTWTSRMPSKWGELIPRIKRNEEINADVWCIGDTVMNTLAFSVFYKEPGDDRPHRRKDDFPETPRFVDEVHPSSWDPSERVKVMDEVGVNMAALYPNLGLTMPEPFQRIAGATLDFQIDLLAAYNDFVLSWAEREPGRFIPLAVVPYWDLDRCVREVERCAEKGHKGWVMTGTPEYHGEPHLDDRHWDPLWDVLNASGSPVAFHAGTTANPAEYMYDETTRTVGGSRVRAVTDVVRSFFDNAKATTNLLMSGVLHRYPEMKFAIVESGASWVPFMLEALDVHYLRYRPWEVRPELSADVLPSDVFRRQVFVNTWYENLRGDDFALLPIDNIMFETDYPHPTCLFGSEVQESLDQNLTALSPDDREKIAFRNAMRCFNLTEDEIGQVNGLRSMGAQS